MSHNLRSCLSKVFSKLTAFIIVIGSLHFGCNTQPQSFGFLKKGTSDASVDPSQAYSPSASLDPLTERSINRYGKIVRKYSDKYGFDWRLILAIMKQESRFEHTAESYRGAYGLMQIMPVTQLEMAERLGVENTTTPYNNIRAGIFHLRTLYRVFEGLPEDDRLRMSLAAYNAGLSRILDAQDVVRFLGDDPNSWKAVRDALPLLSKRYQSLHKSIWEAGMPRGGHFRGWRQTTTYVESIIRFYDEYQRVLPGPVMAGL